MKIIKLNYELNGNAIRGRKNIIDLIIMTCDLLISKRCGIIEKISDRLLEKHSFLVVDKMSRLFVHEDNKIYSFMFPFTIEIEPIIVKYRDIVLTQTIIQMLQMVVQWIDNCPTIDSIISELEITEEYSRLSSESRSNMQEILILLLTFEVGYIRFDIDLENEEKYRKNKKEKVHPCYHLDVGYETRGTYKVGLKKEISSSEFVDLLNVRTDCWFVTE